MEKIVSIGFNISHSPNKDTIARIGDKLTLKAKDGGYLITRLNDKVLIGAKMGKEWIDLRVAN